ncbi:hypothetical protein [Natronospora cellulosivora (SeqCode)]
METFWIYPIYTSVLGIILIILVPRVEIKKLAIPAILLGGVGDIILLLLLKIIGIDFYVNYLPFGFRLPLFPPIAWSIWFIMFFYLLPEDKIIKYIYIVTAGAYSTLFANFLGNVHIIQWEYERLFIPLIIYSSWFLIACWLKEKIDDQMNV